MKRTRGYLHTGEERCSCPVLPRGQGTTGMQSAAALNAALNLIYLFFFLTWLWSRRKGLGKWTIPGNVIGWQQSIYHLPWHPSEIKLGGAAVLRVWDLGNCR